MTPQEASRRLSAVGGPTENLGFALLDHERQSRTGFPEVVFGTGKTPGQIAEIGSRIFERSGVLLVTRTDAAAFDEVTKRVPGAVFNETAGLVWADRRGVEPHIEGVAVVTAGTSDQKVAEEASVTATLMGCRVQRITDVGVAGLHRLVARLEDLRRARVIVVAAGMEGALPSVVAGLVAAPVIAVPTSVGYGASFNGLAALLAMLNSCAAGVSVVNIDNGFSAGYQAAIIAGAGRDGG